MIPCMENQKNLPLLQMKKLNSCKELSDGKILFHRNNENSEKIMISHNPPPLP